MPTLPIEISGTIHQLAYTELLTKGIYVVANTNEVKANCKTLNIFLDPAKPHDAKDSLHSGLRVITRYFPGKYLQYLITKEAPKKELDILLNSIYQDSPQPPVSSNLIDELNKRFQNEV